MLIVSQSWTVLFIPKLAICSLRLSQLSQSVCDKTCYDLLVSRKEEKNKSHVVIFSKCPMTLCSPLLRLMDAGHPVAFPSSTPHPKQFAVIDNLKPNSSFLYLTLRSSNTLHLQCPVSTMHLSCTQVAPLLLCSNLKPLNPNHSAASHFHLV